jgi:hypothetical protein
MKLTILRQFQDKNTAEVYKAGDVKEFEDARAEELLADPRGLVDKYIEKKTTSRSKKAKK